MVQGAFQGLNELGGGSIAFSWSAASAYHKSRERDKATQACRGETSEYLSDCDVISSQQVPECMSPSSCQEIRPSYGIAILDCELV